ncbi:Gfo/Idh/MocA family oxidoreductase [Fulvivirgaceae bacterium BMA12]|uniref:Gfo/Idh/MocA family oxidoreductase n=1 Tax=Agaribacillus aureus TaxID=3051825 RepID=A0ABT8LB07_9BACT|nr:Gfo/Idh/MocA family oxidoreductase [Fulvivirgaceae bacterium BMA12]
MAKYSNRRGFIRKVGLSTAAATVVGSSFASDKKTVNYLKRVKVNNIADDLNIALIGAGGMGTEDTNTALRHEGIKLVAVCDLYEGRRQQAKKKWGQDIFTTDNYKEILKRKDVDAVIIGTPDHWHKQISIDALNAGKHAYCEKPMVHSVDEGLDLIAAWRKSGKVYQVGSQGMSSLGNEKAKALLAEGAIGDLNYAEGFWARHSPTGAWQYRIPDDASEKTVSWKKYISNTTKRPFDAMRFFRWRNYQDYGTGMSGDLFVHLFSSLHFITNSKGPNQVSAMGGLRYWKDGREVPDVLLGMFQYPKTEAHPDFNLSLRCNFVDGTSGSTYLKLVGSEGSMDVKWREVVLKRNKSFSSDDAFAKAKASESETGYTGRKKMLPPEEIVYKAETDYKGAHYDHFGNFFRAIRTGGTVAEDPVFGFRAAAPALLCNDSYRQNDFINWDPENMKIVK